MLIVATKGPAITIETDQTKLLHRVIRIMTEIVVVDRIVWPRARKSLSKIDCCRSRSAAAELHAQSCEMMAFQQSAYASWE